MTGARSYKIVGGLVLATVSAADTAYLYSILARQHAWTAMSITLAVGLVAAAVAAAMGAGLGAGFWTLRHGTDPVERRRGLIKAAVLSALVVAWAAHTIPSRCKSARLTDLRTGPCGPGVVAAVLDDRNALEERQALAANPGCPVETLRALATSSDTYTRELVAANPSFPPSDLEALSKSDPEPAVRDYAAQVLKARSH